MNLPMKGTEQVDYASDGVIGSNGRLRVWPARRGALPATTVPMNVGETQAGRCNTEAG